MAVLGTFSTFTTARLGIYASSASLQVTGNNIANINTTGYTRQRADISSLYSTGEARYANGLDLNIGYGALIESVSQLRDPYLDIRYRNENASLGAAEAKQKGLDQIAHILDEVGRGTGDKEGFGVIEAQFNDFSKQMNNLLNLVGQKEYDNLARVSADTLCKLFNSAAKELDEVYENEVGYLEESVKTVNGLLTQIRDLSEQIRNHAIYGDNALELRDARNVAIDKLSSYIKVDVTYSMEKIDQYTEVEKLTITIPGTKDPDAKSSNYNKPIKLVDGIYATELSIEQHLEENPDYVAGAKKYLDAAGNETDDATDAGTGADNALNPAFFQYVDPYGNLTNSEDEANTIYDDKFLMKLAPLVDKHERYMRDEKTKQELKEETPLNDIDLYGSIQTIRELLTEEGEFSSAEDLGTSTDPNANPRYADAQASTKRGIPYYQKALDNLAQMFAKTLNSVNLPTKYASAVDESGNVTEYKDLTYNQIYVMDTGTDGQHFADKSDPTLSLAVKNVDGGDMSVADVQYANLDPTVLYTAPDGTKPFADLEAQGEAIRKANKNLELLREKGKLSEAWNFYNGGVLFSSNGDGNDPTGITAKNISVSNAWANGDVRILNTIQPNYVNPETGKAEITHTTENDNIQHMITLLGAQWTFEARMTEPDSAATSYYFKGSFQEKFTDLSGTLAADQEVNNVQFDGFNLRTLQLDNDRTSVSGVDLNEEATNMMQFQKSFSAACQLLTTIDSMLERLINGTI